MVLFTKPNETTRRAEQEMLNKIWDKGKDQLNLPESDLIHRSLRPEDIGYTDPVYIATIASTAWQNLVNTYSIADNRFVGINGVNYNTTSISAVQFDREGKTARIWSIQQIMDSEDKIAFADDPITIEQNTLFTLKAYFISTSDSSKVTFVGRVVEPRGLLVNP